MVIAQETKKALKKIVVDSGKFGTKAIGYDGNGKIQKVYFETKMNPTSETQTSDEETFAIELNGERFLIGKNASTFNDSDTTKTKDLHRNAIYTAIHRLVNDNDEVYLVVGCPISVYTDKEKREEYEDFIGRNKDITITVNGITKTFRIANVQTLPESSGYAFKHLDTVDEKLYAIVDIGGLNANCSIYEGAVMQVNTEFTYNLGVNVLRIGLKKKLNQKFSCNLNDKQVEEAMKKRFIKINPEKSREVIDEFFLNHVNKLREAMKENMWDIKNIDFVFTGGGSLLLADEIRKVFGEDVTISDNAVWDNAEGFFEFINIK